MLCISCVVYYAATGGWGFARWTGLELTPHGKDSSSAQACFEFDIISSCDFLFGITDLREAD
jgi:hypothetical protein